MSTNISPSLRPAECPKAAGAASVRIAFTAKAKSKLAGAASVPVKVVLAITDPGGGKRKLSKTVTLKR